MSENSNLKDVESKNLETEYLDDKILDKNKNVLKNKVYYDYGDCSSPSLIRANPNDITNELNRLQLTDDDCKSEEIENQDQENSLETLSIKFDVEKLPQHKCMVNYGQDNGQMVSLEKSFDISPVLTTDYDSVSVSDDDEYTSSTCPSYLTSLTLSSYDNYDNQYNISGNQCFYFIMLMIINFNHFIYFTQKIIFNLDEFESFQCNTSIESKNIYKLDDYADYLNKKHRNELMNDKNEIDENYQSDYDENYSSDLSKTSLLSF